MSHQCTHAYIVHIVDSCAGGKIGRCVYLAEKLETKQATERAEEQTANCCLKGCVCAAGCGLAGYNILAGDGARPGRSDSLASSRERKSGVAVAHTRTRVRAGAVPTLSPIAPFHPWLPHAHPNSARRLVACADAIQISTRWRPTHMVHVLH